MKTREKNIDRAGLKTDGKMKVSHLFLTTLKLPDTVLINLFGKKLKRRKYKQLHKDLQQHS